MTTRAASPPLAGGPDGRGAGGRSVPRACPRAAAARTDSWAVELRVIRPSRSLEIGNPRSQRYTGGFEVPGEANALPGPGAPGSLRLEGGSRPLERHSRSDLRSRWFPLTKP